MADVRSTLTTPTQADFFIGKAMPNTGTPIVIDRVAATAYILNSVNAIVPIGGGAPTNATYVVLSLNGSLTNERVLTAGSGISIVDGGANGPVTISATGASSGVTSGGAALLFESDQGEEGQRGAPGPMGPQGIQGPALWMLSNDGEDGQDGVPGRQGAAGTSGAAGAQGPIVYMEPDAPDDPMMIPGPQGPAGGGGGSFTATRVLVSVPYSPARSATVNVVDAAITATSKIIVSLAGSATTAENDSDTIDLIGLMALSKAGSMDVTFNFLVPHGGPIAINYAVAA